ncbi:MmgE/PrpD family protein [Hirschia litorea]|uniref:MmgE/PrpD family protein n=1 Tax=Hirschia litorea TaxID=1199156 RepID=A0ABW2IH64_9PROT
MTKFIDAIVEHGLTVRFEDMPPQAVLAVKTFLLDTIGVGIAGANAPLAKTIRDSASRWADGGRSNVWGRHSVKTSAANAAFINGFQIHCQEYDCVHEPAVVHPLATILSALMAEIDSQFKSVDGKELAVAMAVAVDFAAGIGVSVSSPLKFFRPANAGIFGATLGISRLRGFDAEKTKNALGYALAFCSGTMQSHVEGKPALPVQIGNGARGAVMACDLAELGMEGPHDSLEGPYGYFALFEDEYDLEPVIQSLGKVWRIAEVSHKPFPTGRAAQGGIVLVQMLKVQGVTIDNLETLTLRAPPIIERLVGRPLVEDMTSNYARLCFQYSGAVALMTGNVTLEDFTDTSLQDEKIHALGQRIVVENDGHPSPSAFAPQTAIAVLKDGKTVEASIDALFGSPASPMSREEHIAKFRSCCAFGWGQNNTQTEDTLIKLTDNLETLDDCAHLSRLATGQET